jgi:26S proteasome regulatory subunit (ATPase 3-interacting protein)
MAPRKPATPKAPSDTAADLVYDYLLSTNRPYSATDVSSNLHNKVTKSKSDKILREMAEEGRIVRRQAGKQWVFHTKQVGLTTSNSLDERNSEARFAERNRILMT